jgi:tetratricopeptide (TPR) repeat protein
VLKQALTAQLEESPYLKILPEERMRRTLGYMNRSRDERITRDLAREICEREGIKAMVNGSIGSLGSRYSLALEAQTCTTGDSLGREQVEASTKEDVLDALRKAATRLRSRLGDSLASVAAEQQAIVRDPVTTASLEAYRQFGRGEIVRDAGTGVDAIPFYRRAIELDPNFAIAYARIAVLYANQSEFGLAKEFSSKAFALRDRVSERERFYIDSHYYTNALEDLPKILETYEQFRRAYPRDFTPANNLGLRLSATGDPEKALPLLREAQRLEPKVANPYMNMAICYAALNRFDEARAVLDEAVRNQVDSPPIHGALRRLAYIRDDLAEAAREEEWLRAKSSAPLSPAIQGTYHEHRGRLRKADELRAAAAEIEARRSLPATVARLHLRPAVRGALLGECAGVVEGAAGAAAGSADPVVLSQAGVALALCGDAARAGNLGREITKLYPQGTLANAVHAPAIQAAIALKAGEPRKAIELLKSALPFDRAQSTVVHLRARACLDAKLPSEAATEYRKVLDRQGAYWDDGAVWAAAHVGLARAQALAGDAGAARKAYEDFFARWKDADPGNAFLAQAKKEYGSLAAAR